MKVRWTDGSIRFRITPTEFGRLKGGEGVAAALSLPGGGGWHAAIEVGTATAIRADGADVRLTLSTADVGRLSAPDAEGVYFEAPGGGTPLRFYVEKDFPCVHPGAAEAKEATTETFAPPPGFKERHTAVCD
jgi:hypothetical protein